VVAIFVVVKFTEGAWVIVVVAPLLYWGLIRLHREYVREENQLESGVPKAVEASILRRHVVVVLVNRLDLASARAIQYARTLTPDDLRAVHFDIDSVAARELEEQWSRLGLARLPLDIIECPDRRLLRAAIEMVADAVVDGDTECTVLLPRRTYAYGWQRFLHDRTADKIAEVVSQVPHVAATIVPFNLSRSWRTRRARRYGKLLEATAEATAGVASAATRADEDVPGEGPFEAGDVALRPGGSKRKERATSADLALASRAPDARPISGVHWRERVRVAGRVKSVRVQPRAGAANLECVLTDGTGGLLLIFQGRPKIPGIEPGARLVAEGMVGAWGRRLAILNPDYELVSGPESDPTRGH
jgi:hypothetical protein